MKNTRVCAPLSVYDALKYFTGTVTPRTFSKLIFSHSFLSYSSFCVNTFSKNFLLLAFAFGHVTVRKLYWILENLNVSLIDSVPYFSFLK